MSIEDYSEKPYATAHQMVNSNKKKKIIPNQ